MNYDGLFNNNAGAGTGIILPEGNPISISVPVQTDTVVATDGAPGVVSTTSFICRPVVPLNAERVEIVCLARWQVTAIGAGAAAATGRINLTTTRNTVAIPGVVVANGTTRALDAIAGPFNEVLHVVIPALQMDADDTLELSIQVELVVAGALGPSTVRLRHDPSAAGSELFFELPVLSS